MNAASRLVGKSPYAVPAALGVLWAIVEADREVASPEIGELVARIHRWLRGNGARQSMNKSFAASRKRSPEKLRAMIGWLQQAEVESRFLEQGAKQAHAALHRGLTRIDRGDLASVAFDDVPELSGAAGQPRRRAGSRADAAPPLCL